MSARPRILVVDDEEAILETMTFTFEDDYEVLTSSSARDALALLEREGPVAVVISDQRMPEMTGVEFLARVFALHPTTVRIILTGFADMDAIIRAINDGHVYAYITKPWEPDQLKQVVRRAVDHHALAVENERLVGDLRGANFFLEAVMDELDTGALAVDAGGIVRAANRLARAYLGIGTDARGRPLEQALPAAVREHVLPALSLGSEAGVYQEMDLPVGRGVRLRVHARALAGPDGGALGRVILAREISHEPARRKLDEIVEGVVSAHGALRERLAAAQRDLAALVRELGETGVDLAGPGRAARPGHAHADGHRVLAGGGRRALARGLPRRAAPGRSDAAREPALAAAAPSRAGARARAARGELLRVRREPEAARPLSPGRPWRAAPPASRASSSGSSGSRRVIASATPSTRARFASSATAAPASRASSPRRSRSAPSGTIRPSSTCGSRICGPTRAASPRKPGAAIARSSCCACWRRCRARSPACWSACARTRARRHCCGRRRTSRSSRRSRSAS